jgi:hypothetical protein
MPPHTQTTMVRVPRGVLEYLLNRQVWLRAERGRGVGLGEVLEQMMVESNQFRQGVPMTVQIDDDLMTSPDTPHQAVRISGTAWAVTWLRRDHRLTRNQAITAMTIASVVGVGGKLTRSDPIWRHVNNWADELGLTGDDAIADAMKPKRWEEPR